jgi:hypothetical protein
MPPLKGATVFDPDEDPEEQVAYLVRLTKSADRVLAEQARDMLDELVTKKFDPNQLRGPDGRWIHIGGGSVGSRVHHPEHGSGTLTHIQQESDHIRPDGAGFSHRAGSATVQFDSGGKHTFEHRPMPGGGDFREDVRARGRNLTQEHRETERFARQEQGAGEFDAAIRQARQANAKKPMTDQELADRANLVEKALTKETVAKYNSATLYKTDGKWTPERRRQQEEIADHMYAQSAHVPSEGKAVVTGGLFGAGKTTTLRGHAGIDPNDFVAIAPDDVKEEMAKRGMVPEIPGHPELSMMERATLIQHESGIIAEMVAARAYADHKNVIWDISMGSGADWMKNDLIPDLRKRGYGNIKGVFVDIPVETSVQRAMSRYRKGMDELRAGEGFGGRYVPPALIRAMKTPDGGSVNRGIFEDVKSHFDDWSLFDNGGSAPVHVESKG